MVPRLPFQEWEGFVKGKRLICQKLSKPPFSAFFFLVVSMMALGPTGVGKSSLLNALLCPATWTIDYEDCHFTTGNGFE